MEENMRDKFPENLVWRYFTPEEMPYARCNICESRICGSRGHMHRIETHLAQHPEVIEEVREEIRRTWLSQYFAFDQVQIWRVKCSFCDNYCNMFKGINNLVDHLRDHMEQHRLAEGAHGEPADAHPQPADQEE